MLRRRYEILLPLRYNDGRPMSDEAIGQTREELLARFDGVSFTPHPIQGSWVHEGVRYDDSSTKVIVDADDTPEVRQFFYEFKLILRERFEQIEIYIVSFPLDVI